VSTSAVIALLSSKTRSRLLGTEGLNSTAYPGGTRSQNTKVNTSVICVLIWLALEMASSNTMLTNTGIKVLPLKTSELTFKLSLYNLSIKRHSKISMNQNILRPNRLNPRS
jgi:hypothetical protein